MNEQEYKDFLTYLSNEYIEGRKYIVLRRFRHPKGEYGFDWQWHRLRASMGVINFIKYHCDSDDAIYKTFRMERLKTTVDGVEDGVRMNKRIASDAGFLSAVEDHFAEILDGMVPEYFPPEELEILQELGSQNPKVELAGIIYLLKARKTYLVSSTKEVSVSKQLDQVVERLSKEQKRFKEETEEQNREISERPGRRWFKALGQICQGAALSIANVGLAVGLLPFSVSPETKTWGALLSTTSGVGMILTGVGDLRNE